MRTVAAACLILLAVATLAASRPWSVQAGRMGPRDVAEIPIESVPAWVSEGVARSIPQEGQGGIEVLAVLRDPRDVPIDRFLYALTDEGEVMVHPEAEAIRRSFEAQAHSAVGVYVRVTAPAEICEDCYEGDPFFVDSLENITRNPDTHDVPWNALGVASQAEGVSVLPCLEPMTIDRRARAFSAPDTGAMIRPDEYLPPMPHYVVTDNAFDPDLLQGEMTAGEVREGWILCLAPDLPVEEVRIVTGAEFSGDSGPFGYGYPMWVPVDEMAVGEWYLLQNRQVLGWNEDPARVQGGEPTHLDEQVVYEGDVWVSMAQALRFIYDPYVDRDGIPVEPFEEQIRVQMYFDGMEELLQKWDQVGLKDGLELSIVKDIRAAWRTSRVETIELQAQGTSMSVGSSSLIASEGRYSGPQELLWVYPGDIREPSGAGPIQVWRIAFQETDEKDLTTDAICAVTECRPVEVEVRLDEYEERLLPVIPVGTRAFGMTVLSARFEQPPVLYSRGLDVFLEEGSNWIYPRMWKFLIIEVEQEGGDPGGVVGMLGDGTRFVAPGGMGIVGGQSYEFGAASGYPAVGGKWLAYARSAQRRVALFEEVPSDWLLGNVVVLRYGGPVWELP